MLTLTSKHKYDKKKNINMSTGKEKNNLNILSGFLRSRCMYRTIPKFLMHHLFFKKFSSGVLPHIPVPVLRWTKISPKKKQKSLVWYSVPSEGTYYLLLYFMHTYFAFRYVPESISLHSSFLFFLRLLRKVDRLWLKRTNLNDDHLNLIILRSLNH